MAVETIGTVQDLIAGLSSVDDGMTFTARSNPSFVSHAELGAAIRARGAGFGAYECSAADRVVLILPGEREFIEGFFGAVWAGLVPVPLFPPFLLAQMDTYIEHIKRVISRCGASLIVTIPQVGELLAGAGVGVPCIALTDLVEGELRSRSVAQPGDIAFIQFTSGSTAVPRGVVVTHERLLTNAAAFADHMGLDNARDRGVTWLPLYHDMGLIGGAVMPLLKEGSVWYMQPLEFARDPASWCQLIHDVRGTIQFAPNFAYSLLASRVTDEQLDSWDLSCWRLAGCAAEPIRADVLRTFQERFGRAKFDPAALLPCYGLAEATLAVTLGDPEEQWRSLRVDAETLRENGVVEQASDPECAMEVVSCGRAIPGHRVRIVRGEAAGECGEDVEGEIEVKGSCVMKSYFNDEEATGATLRNEWLRTGDCGFLHDHELFVTGRSKDVLILNGRNVHPQDIEWCVGDLPCVRRGNVIACARDGVHGEEMVIVLELSDLSELAETKRMVTAEVWERFGLAVADVVMVQNGTLPKTTSGKLQRQAARKAYVDGSLSVLAREGGGVDER